MGRIAKRCPSKLLPSAPIKAFITVATLTLIVSTSSRQQVAALEQPLSTVFVLETADSSDSLSDQNGQPGSSSFEPADESSSHVRQSSDEQLASNSSTRIITDQTRAETAKRSAKPSQVEDNNSNSNDHHSHQHSTTTTAQPNNGKHESSRHQSNQSSSSGHQHHDHLSSTTRGPHHQQHQQQHHNDKQQDDREHSARPNNGSGATSEPDEGHHHVVSHEELGGEQTPRRLDDADADQSSHKSHAKLVANSRSRSSSTTTMPPTEDRLLIQISPQDDDEDNHGHGSGYAENKSKPSSSPSYASSSPSSSNGHTDQGQNQQQKKKKSPTITISFPNLQGGDKQGGSSSIPELIVRPDENGGIVIATANGSQSKRPVVGSSSHQADQEGLYREPSNNPLQSIIQQHSTTRRPAAGHQTASSRPLSSTLLEGHRPSSSALSNEQPSRPLGGQDEASGGYESAAPSRPTQRPHQSRPTIASDAYATGGASEAHDSASSNGPAERPKYPLNEPNCGILHETRIVGGEESNPDDYLWMVAIIKSRPSSDVKPFCGGSLISRRHILTAAHCLEGLAPRDVLVRLGSYDFEDATASSTSYDFAIDQFRVPAQYSKKTHVADIALMRLKTPLLPDDNYKTVCMPHPRHSYVGALGTVTGYGSQVQVDRKASPKLRQVTVPIWENRKCSATYKRNLTESFLCAGYEEGGRDACQGDSGGPLMTEGPNNKMMIVGVVSHGIGCGSPGYPGVYTRTTTFLDWIEKNTRE